MSYFQLSRPDCKIGSFNTQSNEKKIDHFKAEGFCSVPIVVLILKQKVCFYHFCPCQELRPFLIEEDIKRGSEKRGLGELRRGIIQEKRFHCH